MPDPPETRTAVASPRGVALPPAARRAHSGPGTSRGGLDNGTFTGTAGDVTQDRLRAGDVAPVRVGGPERPGAGAGRVPGPAAAGRDGAAAGQAEGLLSRPE